MGGWLSGRASALQAEGHWFKSSTTHLKLKCSKLNRITGAHRLMD